MVILPVEKTVDASYASAAALSEQKSSHLQICDSRTLAWDSWRNELHSLASSQPSFLSTSACVSVIPDKCSNGVRTSALGPTPESTPWPRSMVIFPDTLRKSTTRCSAITPESKLADVIGGCSQSNYFFNYISRPR